MSRAPGLSNPASGELLPQIPQANRAWDLYKYQTEMEIFDRKLVDYLRRMQAGLIFSLYNNTTGDTIIGSGGDEVVHNWDIETLVRVFNSGRGKWSSAGSFYDVQWRVTIGGTIALSNLGTIRTPKVIATPGGQAAPDDAATTSWLATQLSGGTSSGSAFSYTCDQLLVDRLVNAATLAVPLKITTDSPVNSITMNGVSLSLTHVRPTSKVTFSITGWRYGLNTIDINIGDGSTTTGALLEWGVPTW